MLQVDLLWCSPTEFLSAPIDPGSLEQNCELCKQQRCKVVNQDDF